MALQLLSQLGAGALAQTTASVVPSAADSVFNSAGYPGDSSNACDFNSAEFNPNPSGGTEVPVLLTFSDDATDPEQVLIDEGFADLQVISRTMFQVLVPSANVDSTFDDAFVAANSLSSYEVLERTGASLSAAVHGLLSGDIELPEIHASARTMPFVVQHTTGYTPPTLSSLVGTPPSCLNINSTVADIAALYTSETVSDGMTVYSTSGHNDLITDRAAVLSYLMSVVANEPEVLFVSPDIPAHTMAPASLSIEAGETKQVAQGTGVSTSCYYMHDRSITGEGESVAIVDDGLDTQSTFFFEPNLEVTACANNEQCCNFNDADGCANFDEDCSEVATCEDLTDTSLGYALNPVVDGRRITLYVPVADGLPADHGTQVGSTIVGSALNRRGFECDGFEDAGEEVIGVAAGGTAVFVDVGNYTEAPYLRVPATNFDTVLNDFALAQGANVVNLAWGADTGGSADSITHSIDSFVAENSAAGAVVVAASGEKTQATPNAALAKNAISVGVFDGSLSDANRPLVSVAFLDSGLSAGLSSIDGDNFCGYSDGFAGSSAAASVVSGQVMLTEQYLKQEGTIFRYDETGAESATTDASTYLGSTLKAVLVAAAHDDGFGTEYGNGYGVPTLANVLPFDEEHQADLRIEEHTFAVGSGESRSREITITDSSQPLVVTIVYSDTAPSAFAANQDSAVVNDIRLTLNTPETQFNPNGVRLFPNGADDGSASADTAQKIIIVEPPEGTYTITLSGDFVSQSSSPAAQPVSLLVSGRFEMATTADVTGQESGEVTDVPACCPWGTMLPTTSCFPITYLVLIVVAVVIVGLAVIMLIAAKVKVEDKEDGV